LIGPPTIIVCFFGTFQCYIFFAHFIVPHTVNSICLQVTALTEEHTCTSNGRRQTTTPTSSWVASLALLILTKKPQMGVKDQHTTLQDTHNCQIAYETVWKGKKKALS
jgi:hypothetical protein